MAKKLSAYDQTLRERRELLWPGASKLVWDRKEESGFSTLPRTLSLVATLIRHYVKTGDPTRVYFALWLRQRDNGLVEIDNPDDLASECGYSGTRKVRTLHDGLRQLEQLGFILTKPRGSRKYAFVLLLHPHDAVVRLRDLKAKEKAPNRVPAAWWDLFDHRLNEVKAVLRTPQPVGEIIAAAERSKAKAQAALKKDLEDLELIGDDLPF